MATEVVEQELGVRSGPINPHIEHSNTLSRLGRERFVIKERTQLIGAQWRGRVTVNLEIDISALEYVIFYGLGNRCRGMRNKTPTLKLGW